MSIKARFLKQQPPVDIRQMDGMAYIFICQNETQGTETYPDMSGGQTQEAYYEYDYNEIIGPADKIPLEDIQAHPENYLDYVPPKEPADKWESALAEIEELKKQLANTNAQIINNAVE